MLTSVIAVPLNAAPSMLSSPSFSSIVSSPEQLSNAPKPISLSLPPGFTRSVLSAVHPEKADNGRTMTWVSSVRSMWAGTLLSESRNAFSILFRNGVSTVTLVRLAQSAKASVPTVSTWRPSTALSSFEQPLNASLPISCIVPGRLTPSRFAQFLNAPRPSLTMLVASM